MFGYLPIRRELYRMKGEDEYVCVKLECSFALAYQYTNIFAPTLFILTVL
jgi:hypothetical protein